VVEGLALAAFGIMNLMNPHEHPAAPDHRLRDPGRARHVAFGVLAFQGLYREMTAAELRQREVVDSGPASVVKSIFNIAWPWTPAPAAPPPSSA